MKLDVKFSETKKSFSVTFGEIHMVDDGGYERGYADGYDTGNADGYTKGHMDGLSQRTYETWEITLADGTVIEKDVALV